MAINKKEAFSQEEQVLATMAKALSHPARIAILKELAKRNECICGELVDVLPLAQSTVSQHLRELKEAGLIAGTIDGPKSCYCINEPAFLNAIKIFSSFFKEIESRQKAAGCCS